MMPPGCRPSSRACPSAPIRRALGRERLASRGRHELSVRLAGIQPALEVSIPGEFDLIHAAPLAGFALVALGLVLTPGPNMAYLVSRAITQGRGAGLVSLGGVGLGFIVY